MKTMSGPSAPTGSVHTPSGATAVEPSVPAAAMDESAFALGLDAEPEESNPAKKRRTSGPRVRKSRDEAFAEELERIEAKYEELMASLSDTSSGMADCGGSRETAEDGVHQDAGSKRARVFRGNRKVG